MTPPDPAPDEVPQDRLPRHTTPTWEVELLISGIAVFAMLQLPGWLNEHMLSMLPRLAEYWGTPLRITFFYAISAAVILAVTFSLHLLLRAHWIALVGMYSVYPGGVRWDKLRIGPIQREVERERHGKGAEVIERADNRATTLFAIGVGLATTLLIFSVLLVGLFAVATAAAALAGIEVSGNAIFFVCLAILMGPLILINALDRRLGRRLRAGGWLHRCVAGGFALYSRIGLGRGSHAMGLLSSNKGDRRTQWLGALAIVVCISTVIFGVRISRSPELLGSYALFPHFTGESAATVDPAHYADQRDPLLDGTTPFVQSAVITGNYLRLVVPYQPDRDAAAMRQHCHAATTITDDSARAAALLHCLATLHAVTLDGEPLAELHYDASSDPRTERPALIAMIDIRALAPGRHVLRVARPASAEDDDERAASTEWVIPFWR